MSDDGFDVTIMNVPDVMYALLHDVGVHDGVVHDVSIKSASEPAFKLHCMSLRPAQ